MENARKHYGLSDKSPLLSVPGELRIRCQRTRCSGTECADWGLCGPASPFGTYCVHLPHSFVLGHEARLKDSSIPA